MIHHIQGNNSVNFSSETREPEDNRMTKYQGEKKNKPSIFFENSFKLEISKRKGHRKYPNVWELNNTLLNIP